MSDDPAAAAAPKRNMALYPHGFFGRADADGDACPLCLEPLGHYAPGIVRSSCWHAFHGPCVMDACRTPDGGMAPPSECPVCHAADPFHYLSQQPPKRLHLPKQRRDTMNRAVVVDVPPDQTAVQVVVVATTLRGSSIVACEPPFCLGAWAKEGPTVDLRYYLLRTDGTVAALSPHRTATSPSELDAVVDEIKQQRAASSDAVRKQLADHRALVAIAKACAAEPPRPAPLSGIGDHGAAQEIASGVYVYDHKAAFVTYCDDGWYIQ